MSKIILPYPSFKETASVLSDTDLDRQRVDALHVIELLHEVEVSRLPDFFMDANPTESHLAAQAWEGCEMQLCEYALEISEEWSVRNKQVDPLFDIFTEHLDWATSDESNMGMPDWFGNVDYHEAVKAQLLKSNPDWYGAYFTVGA